MLLILRRSVSVFMLCLIAFRETFSSFSKIMSNVIKCVDGFNSDFVFLLESFGFLKVLYIFFLKQNCN